MTNQKYQRLQEEDAKSDSFKTFKNQISDVLILLSSEAEPASETLSFSCIRRCLRLIPKINNAFTNLVLDMNYPVSKWTTDSVDEYMNYSLCLLDNLNLTISSISQLGRSRLSLFHALSLKSIERLKPIKPAEIRAKEYRKITGVNRKIPRGKQEAIIHQAVICMKNVGYRVGGVVLSVLSGNPKAYMEIKKLVSGVSDSSRLSVLDAMMKRKLGLKEMNEVNLAVDRLETSLEMGKQSDEDAGKLQKKLEGFERKMNELGGEVDGVFCKVLEGRNQMLDTIRIS